MRQLTVTAVIGFMLLAGAGLAARAGDDPYPEVSAERCAQTDDSGAILFGRRSAQSADGQRGARQPR
jgi:hypothetical protein